MNHILRFLALADDHGYGGIAAIFRLRKSDKKCSQSGISPGNRKKDTNCTNLHELKIGIHRGKDLQKIVFLPSL